MDHLERIPAPGPDPTMAASDRAVFPCLCGLWRSLPPGIRVGDVCQLVPCPRCGSAPRMRYHGAQVEQVDLETPLTLVEKPGG